jgi:hypothetical protein
VIFFFMALTPRPGMPAVQDSKIGYSGGESTAGL